MIAARTHRAEALLQSRMYFSELEVTGSWRHEMGAGSRSPKEDCEFPARNGAPGWTRTSDPRLTRPVAREFRATQRAVVLSV